MAFRKLFYLVDTSYLMDERARPIEPAASPLFDVTVVIPQQVRREILGNIGKRNKEQKARRAKSLCVEMMGRPNYRDWDLDRIAPITPIEPVFAPDSPVDRRLIALAEQLAGPGDTYAWKFPGRDRGVRYVNACFLLTFDGGIHAEVAVRKHPRVFSRTTQARFDDWFQGCQRNACTQCGGDAWMRSDGSFIVEPVAGEWKRCLHCGHEPVRRAPAAPRRRWEVGVSFDILAEVSYLSAHACVLETIRRSRSL